VETGAGVLEAMKGCEAALYLVHGMGSGDEDFRARQRAAAETFAAHAERAGIGRTLYLGGVEPQGPPSEHLASRLAVGRILRAGAVPCLELRASMIVGYGSESWWIVRDLAARLPVMALPLWMRHRTQPVAIRDVVIALVRGLSLPLEAGASWDIPGPEILSEKEILMQAAEALGLAPPITLDVPLVSPILSSYWVQAVSRAGWDVARELVLGLTEDLLARNSTYWDMIGHRDRLTFMEAARAAIREERAAGCAPEGLPAAVESVVRLLRSTGAPG
jgi:uncharacterized protein YbjT (DUF2867 family)